MMMVFKVFVNKIGMIFILAASIAPSCAFLTGTFPCVKD